MKKFGRLCTRVMRPEKNDTQVLIANLCGLTLAKSEAGCAVSSSTESSLSSL